MAAVKKLALYLLLALAPASAFTATVPISWTNATQNTDGSAIPSAGSGSLVNTRVEYGTCSAPGIFGTKLGEIVVAMPATSVNVNLVVPQMYCLRAFHKNTFNVESDASNVAVASVAAPKPLPPGTLTASPLTVFQIIKRPDRFVMLPVGVVPSGTVCDPAQSVNGMYVVPRAVVIWQGDVQPDVVVAQCS